MDDFAIIESGFNNEDETVNFGTRAIGCDSLYEISTIACIKCSEDNKGVAEVAINSLVKNGRVFLSVNQSIRIFDDLELSAIVFNAVFDSVIDTICVSPNGDFLLICLNTGMVHIFDIENISESKCIFKKCLIQNDRFEMLYIGSYVEHFSAKLCSFLVVSCRGKVYRVYIHTKLNSGDVSSVNVDSEEIYDFCAAIKLTAFSYPLLFLNGTEMSILNVECKIVMSDVPYKLKSMCSLGHKFLALNEEGNLFRICSLTLLIFPIESDTLFDEILTMDDSNGNKQILAVTKKNERGESYLQLLNPDFSQLFSLKISNPVHLIQLENASDETLIISKIFNNSLISELRIQCVCVTEPELRLTRLIRKQRFEEAEKFAKAFNINPVVILKAKAQLYVDKTVCSSEDIGNLINIFESIDDDYFKLQCCSNVECSNCEDVRKILNYGSTIMPKSNTTNKEAVLLLQRVLMDLLFKFDTYMSISTSYDTQTWSRFAACDLIEELKMLLKNFQIEEAIIVCSRLDLETINTLTEERIEEILSILSNIPTTIYQPFLPTFIPIAMAHQPSALSLFVKWLHNKIFHLEKRDNFNFPGNGIKLAEFIIRLLKVDENTYIFFQRQCTLNKEGLSELATLMDALKSIQRLKTDFRINISLSEYLMGPKTVIRNLLNIVMVPEDYDNFLKNFLYKFMIQNQFEADEIFVDEIKNLVKYDEEYWVKIVEAILNYICSVPLKLEAIKEILESARVPWCETIRRIGQSALQYSHPLIEGIKDMLKHEPRLVVLRNPKYKIKEKQIATISDLKYFIKRIVYINEPSMISDVYSLCRSEEERKEANIILIEHFIKNGNFEKAMSVLDDNNPQEIYSCAKYFFSYAEVAINNEIGLNKQRDNYYNVLGSIFRRLVDSSDDTIERNCYNDDLQTLRGVYNLNETFKRNITTDDLRSVVKRNNTLEKLINETIDKFDRGSSDITDITNVCDKLAVCFTLDKNDIMIKFCQKIGKFDVILKVAEHLYANESQSKNLCLIAVLLLRYMGTCEMQIGTDSQSDSSDTFLLSDNSSDNFLNSSDSNNFVAGLRLSESIVGKALLNADEDDLPAVVEVMNWVTSGFYLTRFYENYLQAELFKQQYHSEHTVPGYSAFATVRNTFTTYCSYIGQFGNPNTKFLTYFNKDVPILTEEQLLHEISLLPESVDSLCREGQHLTAYKLITTLQDGLRHAIISDPNVIKLLYTIITKKCLPQLLHVVVSAKHIDLFLFQNLLLASQKDYYKYIEHYLKLYKRQARKLQDIATIGIKLLDHYKVSSGKNVLVNAVTTCKWWNKFKSTISSTIPYDVFFKISTSARLRQLINLNAVDVKALKEYCEDYKLDLQMFYMEYLKSIFVNWKPLYELKTDIDGQKIFIIKNDEESLHSKCQEVIDVIKDKETAFALMNKIWEVANFYHYEVFICILKILSNNCKTVESTRNTDMSMLLFLKNYRRFSVPSQSEKEQWYSTFPDTQTLDPLSEYRLPFIKTLFTYDIWNIIRPEINLKSYKYWFEAINILHKNLKKDDICIYAVKEVVSNGLLGEDVSGNWILYPKFKDLFAEVDECVQYISDLERATSVVYHLMYHTPNGADKVNAAQLSYKYAKNYKENNPNSQDVEKAYTKVKIKYYSFSAMHILHSFQLADEKYLQLVAQPEDLIDALYMDERIIKQAESVNLSCPDINKAVDALGELFNLKVRQMKYYMLVRWLNSSNIDLDFDTSVVIPNVTTSEPNIDDNLKRATYVCSSGDKSFWQAYLLKAGINEEDVEDSEQKSLAFKAKALKCFCAISDVETITRLTEVTYKEFLYYIDKLSLLSELECLGIALNIETLDQYNKRELLKRLSQIGKPVAIKVMATICMTYIIEDLRYWEFIINNTIKLGMTAELKVYVEYLKNKCYKGFYINAWQVIVDNAFNLPITLSNEELHEAYVNKFLMIQSCPVLYSLNFEKIIQKCLKSEKFEFAAILLLYLPEGKKYIYVKEVLQSRTLSLDLDNLSKNGIWGIRRVKSWLASKGLF